MRLTRITLREATPEDWPAIVSLHVEHQAAQGTNYELPYLFGPQIPIALVGVDESGADSQCCLLRGSCGDALHRLRREGDGILRREISRPSVCFETQGISLAGVLRAAKAQEALIRKPLTKAGFQLCGPRTEPFHTRFEG